MAAATSGFSYAQLNELYTSIALEWHYGQKVDVTQRFKVPDTGVN